MQKKLCYFLSIQFFLFYNRSFSLSECQDTAIAEHPAAIEEEEAIIEAEILHTGDKVESARVGLLLPHKAKSHTEPKKREPSPSEPISTLCLTMRKQIISRLKKQQVRWFQIK